jgi:D-arabinose 1-dehydrogenase-like Zn-dependent alcohol dehydrogenase
MEESREHVASAESPLGEPLASQSATRDPSRDRSDLTPAIDGLAVRGRLVVVGVDAKPIQVLPLQLIGASRSIGGSRRRDVDGRAGHARLQQAVRRTRDD